MTTSLICPSVHGATVHKPHRRAATVFIELVDHFSHKETCYTDLCYINAED